VTPAIAARVTSSFETRAFKIHGDYSSASYTLLQQAHGFAAAYHSTPVTSTFFTKMCLSRN
jgi:5-enolpyruvylshikimate-3-phosphate synthase